MHCWMQDPGALWPLLEPLLWPSQPSPLSTSFSTPLHLLQEHILAQGSPSQGQLLSSPAAKNSWASERLWEGAAQGLWPDDHAPLPAAPCTAPRPSGDRGAPLPSPLNQIPGSPDRDHWEGVAQRAPLPAHTTRSLPRAFKLLTRSSVVCVNMQDVP